LRADLVRIWQQERKTILFVTHDIDEAIQLADRIVVFGQRPATIRAIVPLELARPRDTTSSVYLQTRETILTIFGMGHTHQVSIPSAAQGTETATRSAPG
jgi:NitT/TauT family transport system ATP-binding protein